MPWFDSAIVLMFAFDIFVGLFVHHSHPFSIDLCGRLFNVYYKCNCKQLLSQFVSIAYTHWLHKAHSLQIHRSTSALHTLHTVYKLITLQNNHLRMPNAMQCKAQTNSVFKAMRCANFHLKHRKLHVYAQNSRFASVRMCERSAPK